MHLFMRRAKITSTKKKEKNVLLNFTKFLKASWVYISLDSVFN